jgi:pimeloyl-ACP methyl ester carboxylesterase
MKNNDVPDTRYTNTWSDGRGKVAFFMSHRAEQDYVAALLTDVRRITIPGSGHFSALERPGDMARILVGLVNVPSRSDA